MIFSYIAFIILFSLALFFTKLFLFYFDFIVCETVCMHAVKTALTPIRFKCFHCHDTITVLNCHKRLIFFWTIMLRNELCNFK